MPANGGHGISRCSGRELLPKPPLQSLEIAHFAFPGDHGNVTELANSLNDASISHSVVFEFLEPEGSVPLRNRCALTTGMGVPEATVNEHDPSTAAICDVRRSRQVTVVDAKSAAHPVKEAANELLGLRIALPDASQAFGGRRVDDESTAGSRTREDALDV